VPSPELSPALRQGAATTHREGPDDTLTSDRLGVTTGDLRRTLKSTNAVKSMIEMVRDHAVRVKRWQSGGMTTPAGGRVCGHFFAASPSCPAPTVRD
jgi:hypothetical protein